MLGGVIVLEVITQRAFGTGEAGGPPSLSLIVAILVVRLQGLVAAMAYLSLRSGATARDFGLDASRLSDDLRLAGRVFLASIVPVYGIQFFFTQILDMPSKHPLLEMAEANPSAGVLLVISVLAAAARAVGRRVFISRAVAGLVGKDSEPCPGEKDARG